MESTRQQKILGPSPTVPYLTPVPGTRVQNKWSAGEPAAGGNFLYHINFENNGDAPAENVQIIDTMVGGINYLSDTSGLSHAGSGSGPITWDIGTINPGEGGGFDLFVQVTAGAGEWVSNTAEITTSSYNQGYPEYKLATWENEVLTNDTQINIGKDAWTGDPAPGESFIFSVNICNHGGTGSTKVTVTDDLHPSLTLDSWWPQDPGWYEVSRDSNQLIVANPSQPGNRCSEIYVQVSLAGSASVGDWITNTASIAASNDLTPDDNQADWGGNASEPHTNLWINKRWERGSLVPGGELHYSVQYGNDGNVPVGTVFITDTLPEGTTFVSAWHSDPYGGFDFAPSTQDANTVVWQIPGIDNGTGFDFNVNLAIDPGATPGSPLINQVDITDLPGEDNYGDNTAQWTEQVYAPGPNLRVFKYHDWNGDGQLGYNVYFENVGNEVISDLWITDTLPTGTNWDGWWDSNWDWSRFITFTHDSGVLNWNYADFQPQDNAWLYFNADLVEPGTPLRWFTNAVDLTIPPGDPTPGDNLYEDIAFSGGEVRRAELWINERIDSSMWGEAIPGYPITVTMPHGQYFGWADPDCGGCWNIDSVGFITPGITIIVEAGPALQPVTIVVPDPLEAHADSATDEVFGMPIQPPMKSSAKSAAGPSKMWRSTVVLATRM